MCREAARLDLHRVLPNRYDLRIALLPASLSNSNAAGGAMHYGDTCSFKAGARRDGRDIDLLAMGSMIL